MPESMEPGIIQSVFEILYGCSRGMTEEDLRTEVNRRYAVASGLLQHGSSSQDMIDAIEGFDSSATEEETKIGRERRDVEARSYCRLHRCNYIEVKLLVDKFLDQLAIEWASESATDPVSRRRQRRPPGRLIGQ